MPVVAPKVKVVRVTDVPRGDPIIINPSTGQPYTRFGPYVDLGLVNLRDVLIFGNTRPLIPYSPGRIIKSITYVPGGTRAARNLFRDFFFVTPNTSPSMGTGSTNGMARLDNDTSWDTVGMLASNSGINVGILGNQEAELSQIADVGPLLGGGDLGASFPYFLPLVAWQRNTPYVGGDIILDPNGIIQAATSVGGVSGATIPNFVSFSITGIVASTKTITVTGDASSLTGTIVVLDNSDAGVYTIVSATFSSGHTDIVVAESISGDLGAGGIVCPLLTDGTVTWSPAGFPMTGQVHVIAEVIEGVSPTPPFPATMTFVSPPQGFVAGQTMPPVTVIVKDQNGNPYTFTQIRINIAPYGLNPDAFSDHENTDITTGIATFSSLTTNTPGTYVFRVDFMPLGIVPSIFSPPFNVTP